MIGVDWNHIGAERVFNEMKAEMRKPLRERYKQKAPSRRLNSTGADTERHRCLGNGGFETKNIRPDY